ncbi:type I phosphodiesterase/nucleotide pyrophosphatase [Agrococcus jenensis]|uniref:Type I phosphodiesterase/nucleotide pyrophosphatase n=2 Tax=Agrococcus jenensis TaxID=46353 RepID=A0A3N2AVT3_9MICO|nr:type I phosphodiesterase/nucleotide pyrophosphatase [Agrococcus jenensis]
MRGEQNPLGLPRVAGAVVLLVDGLGASQLGQRAGHARTLAGAPGGSLDAGFPSTTAVALASLTTGALAGEHGIVGYDALVPGAGVRNQLRDWGGPMDPAHWQRRPTLFESTTSIAIGEPRHAAGGFTNAVLRGAAYRGGRTMAERFALAEQAARERALVYLYVPELDRAGHDRGWQSPAWTDALEEVDGLTAQLAASLRRDVGLIVTADHGMVDVDASGQRIAPPELLAGLAHVAGEPRCLQLHVDDDTDADAVAEAWRAWLGDGAWVATRQEVVDAGWLGEVHPEVAPRLGDVFVAVRGRTAIYLDADDPGRGMVGQHGSLTPDELRVPLRRFGAFA